MKLKKNGNSLQIEADMFKMKKSEWEALGEK
jgi:hypothetical protein